MYYDMLMKIGGMLFSMQMKMAETGLNSKEIELMHSLESAWDICNEAKA